MPDLKNFEIKFIASNMGGGSEPNRWSCIAPDQSQAITKFWKEKPFPGGSVSISIVDIAEIKKEQFDELAIWTLPKSSEGTT
jgi:hypothetical protein